MNDKPKVSQEAMEWAAEQIKVGALESDIARHADGTPKTVRDLTDEARRRKS